MHDRSPLKMLATRTLVLTGGKLEAIKSINRWRKWDEQRQGITHASRSDAFGSRGIRRVGVFFRNLREMCMMSTKSCWWPRQEILSTTKPLRLDFMAAELRRPAVCHARPGCCTIAIVSAFDYEKKAEDFDFG